MSGGSKGEAGATNPDHRAAIEKGFDARCVPSPGSSMETRAALVCGLVHRGSSLHRARITTSPLGPTSLGLGPASPWPTSLGPGPLGHPQQPIMPTAASTRTAGSSVHPGNSINTQPSMCLHQLCHCVNIPIRARPVQGSGPCFVLALHSACLGPTTTGRASTSP